MLKLILVSITAPISFLKTFFVYTTASGLLYAVHFQFMPVFLGLQPAFLLYFAIFVLFGRVDKGFVADF
jgi:hypothetical protein